VSICLFACVERVEQAGIKKVQVARENSDDSELMGRNQIHLNQIISMH